MKEGVKMQTEHIIVENLQEHFDKAGAVLDDYISKVKITGKNATRFSLLAEEALRLVKSITSEDTPVELWIEGNARVSHICLKLNTNIDVDKEAQFVSVSTKGENSADRTFFDDIKSFFINPKSPTWSLRKYEADLMQKRAEDKYSEEAWDNLERSVLANLADDINVGVKNNHVLMIITKDFTSSLSVIGAKRPILSSHQIFVASEEAAIEKAYKKVDECTAELKLSSKDELRIKLILEETIGMFEEIIEDFTALLWVEKYKDVCAVKLIGNAKLDADKKLDVLSLSSSGKNALVHGFMGKLKDMIETGILSYESVMKLNQEYNGVSINYAGIGAYTDVSAASNPAAMAGFMWSMVDYRNALKEDKDSNEGSRLAWDELEKSIVASISDDVIVGVQKNKVQITIVYRMKED